MKAESSWLLTFFLLIYYNRWIIKVAPDVDKTVKKDGGIFTKSRTGSVALIMIPVVLFASWSLGTLPLIAGPDVAVSTTDWSEYDIMTEPLGSESGNTGEGSDEEVLFFVDRSNVANVTFTLTWTDEPAQGGLAGIRYTNQPDRFSFTVTPANGTAVSSPSVANVVGSAGSIELRIPFDTQVSDPYYNWTGEYSVVVACEQAGDHEPVVSIGGLRDNPDTGNAWTLTAEVEFYVQPNL